ncbi:MAG TPA: DUF2059 domain-containing protein [Opitutaceae bacterium]|jgi:hypothetical protein|nr:DUF2059 domain-containing protein [Opitutaceae bacterium]
MKTLRLLLLAPFFACTALFAQSAVPAVETPPAPAPETVAAPVAQISPADAADTVLKALHYDEMMGKALDGQKQLINRMIGMAIQPGTPKEAIAAFQQKAMDTAMVGLSSAEIHAVAARSYVETFTADELRAIADFYNSPAGRAFLAKQPSIQQKIMETLRPRVTEARQKIQQMTRDFVAQQQAKAAEDTAKAAAAKPSATAAPAASATTPAPAPKP